MRPQLSHLQLGAPGAAPLPVPGSTWRRWLTASASVASWGGAAAAAGRVQVVASGLLAAIYLALAITFGIYGWRFYGMISRISQVALWTRLQSGDIVFKVRHADGVAWEGVAMLITMAAACAAGRLPARSCCCRRCSRPFS